MPISPISVSTTKRKQTASDLKKHQFVMLDPALCLCPGLFRVMKLTFQEWCVVELKIRYEHNENTLLEIQSPAILSGFDLAMFQAVSSLAHGSEAVSPGLEITVENELANELLSVSGN